MRPVSSISIGVPDPRWPPGLTWRHVRDRAHYDQIVDLIAESNAADQIERVTAIDNLTDTLAHLAGDDPYRNTLLAEVDGRIVGFSYTTWNREFDGTWVYWITTYVHPDLRPSGIERAMLHYNEQRLSEIASTLSVSGQHVYSAFIEGTAIDKQALFEQEGYTAARHYYLMIRDLLEDLPEAQLPPGLVLRPALPEHYRAIWDAEQEAFADHWGFSPATQEEYEHWVHSPTLDPSLWQIVWDGDQIAGQARSLINTSENSRYNRRRGYLSTLSVRRPWRQRGLARALAALSLQALKQRGMTEATLVVDAENHTGAVRLYESCGYRVVKRNGIYRKPLLS